MYAMRRIQNGPRKQEHKSNNNGIPTGIDIRSGPDKCTWDREGDEAAERYR